MIRAVDNYKTIKSFLERMGEPVIIGRSLKPSEMTHYNNLLKDYPRNKVQDFLTVCLDVDMVKDDELLNQYANCEITATHLKEQLGVSKRYDYKSYIKEAAVMRTEDNTNVRHMETHWITGSSGSGKSAFAIYMANKKYRNDQIFKASQGEHMFDCYDLQQCFILDEFRGSSMKFSDYLQLTDNNVNVKMNARYHNVDFKNCKDLFITSIQKPSEAYANMMLNSSSDEPIYQAYRRLKFRYYEIVRKDEFTGEVYIKELDEKDCTTVVNVTKIYDIKYGEGAPEFIELKEPISFM